MSEIVRCPDCDEKVPLKPGKATVTCPACGGRFAVEGPSDREDRRRDEREEKPAKKTPKRKYREEWDDEDEDDKPTKPVKRGGSLMWLWITLGILAFVGACCGGGVWGFYTFVKKARDEVVQRNQEWQQKLHPENPQGRAKHTPQPDASFYPKKKPFDADPALSTKPSPVYLSELQPFEVKQGPWPLGRNGAMGAPDGRWIVVGGTYYDHGIGMHPPDKGVSQASFALGGQARRLKGNVALNDDWHAGDAWGTGTFAIYKDGKEVWRSAPIKSKKLVIPFDVDVSGARIITLETTAADQSHDLHCVWLDPVLDK